MAFFPYLRLVAFKELGFEVIEDKEKRAIDCGRLNYLIFGRANPKEKRPSMCDCFQIHVHPGVEQFVP